MLKGIERFKTVMEIGVSHRKYTKKAAQD